MLVLARRQPLAARAQGRGRALFERLLSLRTDLGLLAEEYDPRAGRLVGNFPQAFSHVGLVNSAFNLSAAETGSRGDWLAVPVQATAAEPKG